MTRPPPLGEGVPSTSWPPWLGMLGARFGATSPSRDCTTIEIGCCTIVLLPPSLCGSSARARPRKRGRFPGKRGRLWSTLMARLEVISGDSQAARFHQLSERFGCHNRSSCTAFHGLMKGLRRLSPQDRQSMLCAMRIVNLRSRDRNRSSEVRRSGGIQNLRGQPSQVHAQDCFSFIDSLFPPT
jgi:hypothetical protein